MPPTGLLPRDRLTTPDQRLPPSIIDYSLTSEQQPLAASNGGFDIDASSSSTDACRIYRRVIIAHSAENMFFEFNRHGHSSPGPHTYRNYKCDDWSKSELTEQ
uniref:Uncharacterized protein n=1 Tax=Plectus sambesii TaxID=2011161 RepID=A0A914VTS5_9BILA